jgi:UDP-N-acetylmuramoyl-tripeptide--D-alanyl-D-alanine ligase
MDRLTDIYNKFRSCSGFTTDSRQIEAGQMFFCLKGANFNGNKFAAEALEKGAAFVLIDEEEYFTDVRMILVEDVLRTMQDLARFHRRKFDIPVLGITGTNGKTTTKELVYAVLSRKYKTHATKGNFNNHIGVPITLLSMPDDTEFAIIEMGANHPGEIAELCAIAEPDYGIITSIGKAHLEGFGSLQGVINTKNELYQWVRSVDGMLFVNAGNPLLMELSEGIKRRTYGSGPEADIRGELLLHDAFVGLRYAQHEIISQLVGSYNFDNMMAAVCTGNYFEVPDEVIADALRSYRPQNQRSQFTDTGKNRVVLDAYNANPTSMMAALESFRQAGAEAKVVILGDMLELGAEREKEHRAIVEQLQAMNFEQVILVGPEFVKAARDTGFLAFDKNTEALEYLKEHPIKDRLILLKGSRGIAVEILLEAL